MTQIEQRYQQVDAVEKRIPGRRLVGLDRPQRPRSRTTRTSPLILIPSASTAGSVQQPRQELPVDGRPGEIQTRPRPIGTAPPPPSPRRHAHPTIKPFKPFKTLIGYARSVVATRKILGVLGVHFAITREQERALLAADEAGDGGALAELLEEIEESWDDDALKVATDQAWDAIHRSLTEGTLDPDDGEFPLSLAVLGGNHLHDDIYVVHITAPETRAVAEALQAVDRAWLRPRFDAIDDPHYRGAGDDTDFEYTWANFVDLRDFFQRAATAGRSVLFTAT
jgi:hypothetical protein